MNISSSIAFEAPLVSYAETARVARRAAAVLAMTGLVSLAAFAHVFPGQYQSA